MRVVAGSARGRRIAVPAGTTTRPTSDRTREAVFGRLDAWRAVVGAQVLDLYCGSGARALEALSRGAVGAVGVEADRSAARVAAENARTLGLALVVVHERVSRYVSTAGEAFDLVLLDPPYDLDGPRLAQVLLGVVPRCRPEAVVVVERAARSPEPVWPAGLEPVSPKTYGETTVWFAERV